MQLLNFAARLFTTFAYCDLGFGFAIFNHTRYTFNQPGRFFIPRCAGAKLLDQYNFTTLQIIR